MQTLDAKEGFSECHWSIPRVLSNLAILYLWVHRNMQMVNVLQNPVPEIASYVDLYFTAKKSSMQWPYPVSIKALLMITNCASEFPCIQGTSSLSEIGSKISDPIGIATEIWLGWLTYGIMGKQQLAEESREPKRKSRGLNL